MDTLSPFESLYDCIVFDSRDWSIDRKDAWIYGIVVGWNEKSLNELSEKHGWDEKTCTRLKILRAGFKQFRERHEPKDKKIVDKQ